MPLPKLGTMEWSEEVRFYINSTETDRIKRAKKYGIKVSSYERMMRKRGIGATEKEANVVIENLAPPERIPYPDLNIIPFSPPKSNRDEEDLGVVIADIHTGKKTESYSIDIMRQRFASLTKSIMTIINLHRPIRKVWVFDAGDNVQGENPYQGSKLGETECGAYEQIYSYAIPIFSDFLVSLSQGVSEIEVIGVDGNHGIYDKVSPRKTNWDGFFYSGLKSALQNQKNIHIHPPKTFYQLVNIRGFRFFLIHGNQVYATQGIPLFAMRRKMQEWYAYVGGFNYGYAGHFHSGAYDQVNSHADYTICPPLVTGDSWALEKVGRASEPVQLCFGIHNHYGRTFEYKLRTDNKFLPQRYDDPEGVITIGR